MKNNVDKIKYSASAEREKNQHEASPWWRLSIQSDFNSIRFQFNPLKAFRKQVQQWVLWTCHWAGGDLTPGRGWGGGGVVRVRVCTLKCWGWTKQTKSVVIAEVAGCNNDWWSPPPHTRFSLYLPPSRLDRCKWGRCSDLLLIRSFTQVMLVYQMSGGGVHFSAPEIQVRPPSPSSLPTPRTAPLLSSSSVCQSARQTEHCGAISKNGCKRTNVELLLDSRVGDVFRKGIKILTMTIMMLKKMTIQCGSATYDWWWWLLLLL